MDLAKCPRCGWLHVAISERVARAQVQEANEYLISTGASHRASYDDYLRCFRCGASSSTFVDGSDSDAPMGSTLQAVVVERKPG